MKYKSTLNTLVCVALCGLMAIVNPYVALILSSVLALGWAALYDFNEDLRQRESKQVIDQQIRWVPINPRYSPTRNDY